MENVLEREWGRVQLKGESERRRGRQSSKESAREIVTPPTWGYFWNNPALWVSTPGLLKAAERLLREQVCTPRTQSLQECVANKLGFHLKSEGSNQLYSSLEMFSINYIFFFFNLALLLNV